MASPVPRTPKGRDRSAGGVRVATMVADMPTEAFGSQEELLMRLEVETRKSTMLEAELRLALAAQQRAEEAHQKELAAVEADVKRLLGERKTLLGKLQTIEAVEDSVCELYVQMKDRIAEDGRPTPEQLQAEKAALRQENIMVVLGCLHATLKGLWAFKVEAEDDLKASRMAQHQQASAKVVELREVVRGLEAEVRRAHQDTAAAVMRAEMAEDAAESLAEEAHSKATAMAALHAELLAALKTTQAEADAARKAAAAASEEGKKRDSLVFANRQLESARHFDRAAQDRELRRLQAEHEVQLSAMQRELHRVADLMARNNVLGQQLEAATSIAAQLRKSQQPSRIKDLEHRVKGLEVQLEQARDRLRVALAAKGRSGSPGGAEGEGEGSPAGSPRPGTAPASRLSASSRSMAARAAAIMAEARSTTRKERAAAAAEKPNDPVYRSIGNVGVMFDASKAALKDMRRELHEGTQAAHQKLQEGVPQATSTLEQSRQPLAGGYVGAAGYNSKASPSPGKKAVGGGVWGVAGGGPPGAHGRPSQRSQGTVH